MNEQTKEMALLAEARKLADEAGIEEPEGLQWGMKSVQADLRTHEGFRWPASGWTPGRAEALPAPPV